MLDNDWLGIHAGRHVTHTSQRRLRFGIHQSSMAGAASVAMPGPDPKHKAILRSRGWFITINYAGLEGDELGKAIQTDVVALSALKYKYLCIGQHLGAQSHIVHIHACLEYVNQVMVSTVKRAVPRARIEVRHGSVADCRKYCDKDHHMLYEDGDMSMTKADRWAAINQLLEEGHTPAEIRQRYPEECFKAYNAVEHIYQEKQRAIHQAVMVPPVAQLYPWQDRVIRMVEGPVDDRKIVWILDPVGNCGKTWLCKKLVAEFGASFFTNAKTADIIHGVDFHPTPGHKPIALFNLTRSCEGGVNYAPIEQLKDGIGFSGKYDSKMKTWSVPHVICFSNFPPDTTKLSKDRWIIMRVSVDHSVAQFVGSMGAAGPGYHPYPDHEEKKAPQVPMDFAVEDLPAWPVPVITLPPPPPCEVLDVTEAPAEVCASVSAVRDLLPGSRRVEAEVEETKQPVRRRRLRNVNPFHSLPPVSHVPVGSVVDQATAVPVPAIVFEHEDWTADGAASAMSSSSTRVGAIDAAAPNAGPALFRTPPANQLADESLFQFPHDSTDNADIS